MIKNYQNRHKNMNRTRHLRTAAVEAWSPWHRDARLLWLVLVVIIFLLWFINGIDTVIDIIVVIVVIIFLLWFINGIDTVVDTIVVTVVIVNGIGIAIDIFIVVVAAVFRF